MSVIESHIVVSFLNQTINTINGCLWDWVLPILLTGVGLYFSCKLRFLQLRYFFLSWKLSLLGKNDRDHHVSPFEALATSLAARVGTGNIAGVAVAITLGGPGAVFWMWVVALLGMATAFVEATLAQLFKHAEEDGTFIGGPAYYIQRGLGQRWLGVLFSLSLMLAFGCVFIAIQSNTVAQSASGSLGVPHLLSGGILVLLAVPMIFGGVTRIAHVAGKIVPLMAGAYLGVAIVVIILEIDKVPGLFFDIVSSAFGFGSAGAGALGVIISNGVKRGLFSNEAGMGSAPNIAAAADPTPPHPAAQGFVQMLGVYIDTIFVCTATALIILLSGVYTPGQEMQAVTLTQQSLVASVGSWGDLFITIVIFFFCFTTILGNYAYAESCLKFITHNSTVLFLYRLIAVGMILLGVLATVPELWNAADATMAFMAIINLIAIALLGKYVFVLFDDFIAQLKEGKEPVFDPKLLPELKGKIDEDVWFDPDDPDESEWHKKMD